MNTAEEFPSDKLPNAFDASQAEFTRIFEQLAADVSEADLPMVPVDQIDYKYVMALAAKAGITISQEEAHYIASLMVEYFTWLNHFSTWPYVGDAPLG